MRISDWSSDVCSSDLLLIEVVNEAVGLGPLEPLLADQAVTEIMVNRHEEIFVEINGQLKRHTAAFSSEQAVLGVIDRIVSPLGRRIDASSTTVNARISDGSRVNAVLAPVARSKDRRVGKECVGTGRFRLMR